MKTIHLKTAQETEDYAAQWVSNIQTPAIIYLEGQLGAGKTTFVKGFLRGLGFLGLVKSPTYTLIETYFIDEKVVVHADLYRLKDPHELDMLGFRDYFAENTIVIVEWASNAQALLPAPTIQCHLKINGEGRILEIREL